MEVGVLNPSLLGEEAVAVAEQLLIADKLADSGIADAETKRDVIRTSRYCGSYAVSVVIPFQNMDIEADRQENEGVAEYNFGLGTSRWRVANDHVLARYLTEDGYRYIDGNWQQFLYPFGHRPRVVERITNPLRHVSSIIDYSVEELPVLVDEMALRAQEVYEYYTSHPEFKDLLESTWWIRETTASPEGVSHTAALQGYFTRVWSPEYFEITKFSEKERIFGTRVLHILQNR